MFWACPTWLSTPSRRLSVALLVLAVLTATWLVGCGRSQTGERLGGPASYQNLLSSAVVTHNGGAHQLQRLTDGVTAQDGDHWRTNLTVVLPPRAGHIEFDLGRSVKIGGAYLQGDNNDRYVLKISEDGKTYRPLWTASSVGRSGLRPRHNARLNGQGRYVQLSATGGDGSYALSELLLVETPPATFPPVFEQRRGVPAEDDLRSRIVWFGAALAFFAVATLRRWPWWTTLLAAVVPLAVGAYLAQGVDEIWPVGQREVSLLRAVAAFAAAVAIVREVFVPRRHAPDRRAIVATLAVSATLAMACFFNLGHPQFWEHKENRPSFVHNYDMRVYFPVAKYFDELRFDGLYLASVKAFFDDVPRANERSYGHVELRDLKTHRTQRVAEVGAEMEQVKKRFSPERWEEFKRDMRYFRENMGIGAYLGTLTDHGGNATPAWFTIAHFMFAKADANNTTLFLTGLLDPLLLIIAFAAIGRTFGVRTMLVAATVFGANDFYMFGSNWAGATLRHDWMAALALGACALRRERWMLGGALLAYAALIRAFPALALICMALPAAWWAYEYRKEHGALPGVQVWRAQQQPLFKALLGAAGFSAFMVVLSSLVLGPETWVEWYHKVRLLDGGAHVNHVSLRALVGFNPSHTMQALIYGTGRASWNDIQGPGLRLRAVAVIVIVAFFVTAVVLGARRRRLEQAALLGLFLVPIAFNPANYYIHLIFVWPLLAVERSWTKSEGRAPVNRFGAFVWACLLAMCVAQYQTVLETRLDAHFYGATVILFVGMAAMLLAVVAENRWKERRRAARDAASDDRLSTAPEPTPSNSDEAPESSTPRDNESPSSQPQAVTADA